ncbi:hypothetical protein ABZP36_006997 [Zizania latifolia]
MGPTGPNGEGGGADGTVPTNTTVNLPPLTLRDVPRLTAAAPVVPNPISRHPYFHPSATFYISPGDVSLRHAFFDLASATPAPLVAYRRAGPRQELSIDPARARAALVTCGGLCPGLNTVLRELVVGLQELYGVRDVFGVAAGYRGFYGADADHIRLDLATVDDWHKKGGTVLKTTRGGFDLNKIVDGIVAREYTQVYVIGGDGTMRGAVAIFKEFKRRGLNISITGIPKTVDNDIGIIDRSFGFQTAVEIAQQAIDAARVEAVSAVNGIGLVKLMGRSTGHIALHATLSSRDVDCCLVPELDFYLEDKGGLFEFLYERIKQKGHAVVVVAEGAGQELIPRTDDQKRERDESGNIVFLDVGPWLKSELGKWWKREHPGELFTVKYIDPTYMIRAVPANATDNLYCTLLAHSAIHGIMAGYTGFVPGPINGNYCYIPLEDVAAAKNPVDVNDHKWAWVRSVTNQPDFLNNPK